MNNLSRVYCIGKVTVNIARDSVMEDYKFSVSCSSVYLQINFEELKEIADDYNKTYIFVKTIQTLFKTCKNNDLLEVLDCNYKSLLGME